MRRHRKRPRNVNIRPETNDENTLATLRNSIVGCVEQPPYDAVPQLRLGAVRLDALQTRKMFSPVFAISRNDSGIRELKHDVAEIFCEGFAKQTFDVFEYERARANLSHSTRSLGKKISAIPHRTMLTSDGKWLAGRPARDEVNTSIPRLKILIMNIALNERPVPNEFVSSPLIRADGLAGMVIIFEHGIVLETGV